MKTVVLLLAGALQVVGALATCSVVLRFARVLPPDSADRAALLGIGGIVVVLIGQGVADACR